MCHNRSANTKGEVLMGKADLTGSEFVSRVQKSRSRELIQLLTPRVRRPFRSIKLWKKPLGSCCVFSDGELWVFPLFFLPPSDVFHLLTPGLQRQLPPPVCVCVCVWELDTEQELMVSGGFSWLSERLKGGGCWAEAAMESIDLQLWCLLPAGGRASNPESSPLPFSYYVGAFFLANYLSPHPREQLGLL